MSKKAKTIWTTLIFFSIIAVVIIATNPIEFFQIDRCLDRGGSWDYDVGECT